MFNEFARSLRLTLVTFVLCGLLYPLATTAIAQAAFRHQAEGSLLMAADGKLVGSALVGQRFEGSQWFHGRVSCIGYKAEASGASNLGPTNQALLDRVALDAARIRAETPMASDRPLPVDLLTQSGSGLDPHITPAAALLQAPRVAATRGIPESEVRRIVEAHTEDRDLGIFGERRVNVLELNLALAAMR